MKVVILCGGQGTRIRGVADDLPKPMIPVGEFPILWHIMKSYATRGHKDFVLCLGHKGAVIKDFFLNYQAHLSDVSLTLGDPGSVTYHNGHAEADWRITLAETGLDSLTGTRVLRVRRHLDAGASFLLTYGDGVGDIDFDRLIAFHRAHGRAVTLTGVRPPGRFGELNRDPAGRVLEFNEKPQASGGLISGGFFVCEPRLFDYLDPAANQMLEEAPMRRLAADGELMVYDHDGFWQCMDTYRDWKLLNDLWDKGKAPWKTW